MELDFNYVLGIVLIILGGVWGQQEAYWNKIKQASRWANEKLRGYNVIPYEVREKALDNYHDTERADKATKSASKAIFLVFSFIMFALSIIIWDDSLLALMQVVLLLSSRLFIGEFVYTRVLDLPIYHVGQGGWIDRNIASRMQGITWFFLKFIIWAFSVLVFILTTIY